MRFGESDPGFCYAQSELPGHPSNEKAPPPDGGGALVKCSLSNPNDTRVMAKHAGPDAIRGRSMRSSGALRDSDWGRPAMVQARHGLRARSGARYSLKKIKRQTKPKGNACLPLLAVAIEAQAR